MSEYTTQVRFICEQKAGLTESVGYSQINNVLAQAWPKIFESFPIWDEAYRPVLCQKILKHYYMREICCETVGLWQFWLNERLNYIMPYYNILYESTQLKFNPLMDVDYTRSGNREDQGIENLKGKTSDNREIQSDRNKTLTNTHADQSETQNEINNNTSNTNVYSDTPQGALEGVLNLEYLTNATKDDGEEKGTSNQSVSASGDYKNTESDTYSENNTNDISQTSDKTSNNTEEYVEQIKGKMGGKTYPEMIQQYRDSLINIDGMIIDELKDLFFMLW